MVLGESEIAKGVVKVSLDMPLSYSHFTTLEVTLVQVRSVATREEVEVARGELVAALR